MTRRASWPISPEREALLRNPTLEGALKFWNYKMLGEPANEFVPLAGVHKARLAWSGSTKAMIKESKKWLADHGFGALPAEFYPSAPQASKYRMKQ